MSSYNPAKQRTGPSYLVIRYFSAALLALLSSLLTSSLVLAFYGFPDAGVDLLRATKLVGFAAIACGGLCFPLHSRWLHSTILLMVGLAFYCVTEQWQQSADHFFHAHRLPLFWSLTSGGVGAVGLHGIVSLIWCVVRRSHPQQVGIGG